MTKIGNASTLNTPLSGFKNRIFHFQDGGLISGVRFFWMPFKLNTIIFNSENRKNRVATEFKIPYIQNKLKER